MTLRIGAGDDFSALFFEEAASVSGQVLFAPEKETSTP